MCRGSPGDTSACLVEQLKSQAAWQRVPGRRVACGHQWHSHFGSQSGICSESQCSSHGLDTPPGKRRGRVCTQHLCWEPRARPTPVPCTDSRGPPVCPGCCPHQEALGKAECRDRHRAARGQPAHARPQQKQVPSRHHMGRRRGFTGVHTCRKFPNPVLSAVQVLLHGKGRCDGRPCTASPAGAHCQHVAVPPDVCPQWLGWSVPSLSCCQAWWLAFAHSPNDIPHRDFSPFFLIVHSFLCDPTCSRQMAHLFFQFAHNGKTSLSYKA